MQLYEKTASQLAVMLREKQCSALEAAQSFLGRIQAVDDKVKAYLAVDSQRALAAAAAADKKIAAGGEIAPLCGIPVGIKDNICQKGLPTTCASKMLEGFTPPYNATVIERLLDQNAVLLGKCNLDEFAMGSSCENSYFKKTANPHDLTRVPGGSSGGSAAAVAAGEAAVTLGSDTGGSIRQPAAYCGVVGLKPTYGAVSRYGLVAFASSLDQIGPLGRSVDDVALLFDAICGLDVRDATSAAREWEPVTGAIDGGANGFKIGIPAEYFGHGVDDEVKASVMAQAKKLEGAGAQLVSVSLPGTKYALSAYYIISSAEASSNLARFDGVKYGYRAENAGSLEELYLNSRTQGFGDEVKRRIMLGTFVLSSGYIDAYYKKAKLFQARLKGEFDAAFASCDVILTPTAPDTAFRFGEHSADPLRMYASDVCTVPVNIAGLPAMSLPCGRDKNSLPIGVQLIGAQFSEKRLLTLAKACEQLSGGYNTLPALV